MVGPEVAGRGSSHGVAAAEAFLLAVDQEAACIPLLQVEVAWDAYAEEQMMPAAAEVAVAAAGVAVESTTPEAVDREAVARVSAPAVAVAAAVAAAAAAAAAHPQSALSFSPRSYHHRLSSPPQPSSLLHLPPLHSPKSPRPRLLRLPSPLSRPPLP